VAVIAGTKSKAKLTNLRQGPQADNGCAWRGNSPCPDTPGQNEWEGSGIRAKFQSGFAIGCLYSLSFRRWTGDDTGGRPPSRRRSLSTTGSPLVKVVSFCAATGRMVLIAAGCAEISCMGGIDADRCLSYAAALAHDLGHPAFGPLTARRIESRSCSATLKSKTGQAGRATRGNAHSPMRFIPAIGSPARREEISRMGPRISHAPLSMRH